VDGKKMTDNKVVVRYQDGTILKGFTHDFGPEKQSFHVIQDLTGRGTEVVDTDELKAVFFVKSFEGDSRRIEDPEWEILKRATGVKVKVVFKDGEVIYGIAPVYNKHQRGFFIRPADQESNNERIFVLTEATTAVETWL